MQYFLELTQEGQIEGSQDKAIYIYVKQPVRFYVRNKIQSSTPYLILRNEYKKLHRNMEGKTLKQIQQNHVLKQFTLDSSGDFKLDIDFKLPGAAYIRLCFVQSPDQPVKLGCENHVIVQPILVDKLREITIQTLLPHSLGQFVDYEKQIESQVKLGYDAFHLPPIQQLGQSPSLYAINDQLKLNKDIFGDATYKDLQNLFAKFPNQYFFIDILLNHTAFDSQWLIQQEFKDASYNKYNSPHLEVAIRLDCAIAEFSNKLGQNQISQYPRNTIYNEHDLDQIMNILEYDVIRQLNLHDFFQFNVEQVLKELIIRCPNLIELKSQQAEENQNIFISSPCEILLQLIKEFTILKGAKRFGVELNYDIIVDHLKKDQNYLKISQEYIIEVLNYYNKQYYQEAESYIQQAIQSTRGQITWWKLTLQNPIVQVNEKGDSLVPRYFTKLSNGEYVANNGWIQGFDPLNNFAENQEHHYLRRTIVIWGDLVKLRYGKTKADSPALWKYMKQYVQGMARIFNGLRLDNAHSTPLIVGEYMMRQARKANPNILVFAELFTGSPIKDTMFTKAMGINCLVRETNRCHESGHLNRDLHYYSGNGLKSIGSLPKLQESFESITGPKFTILQPQYSPALIYDQSHDNETLISSHGYKHQLPIAALISFSNCMGGTVRGYDIYTPNKLSVVDERRRYKITQPHEDVNIIRTSNIVFRYDGEINQQVEIIGSWDNWQVSHKLNESANIYFTTLNLPIGNYEYNFKINGDWLHQPNRSVEVIEQAVKKHSTLELIRAKLHQIKKQLNEKYPNIFCQTHSDSILSITRESNDGLKQKMLITVPQFGTLNQFQSIKLPGKLIKVDAIYYHEDYIQYPELNNQFIEESQVCIVQHTNIREFCEIVNDELKFVNLPLSFTAILECEISKEHSQNLANLEQLLNDQKQIQNFKNLTSEQINDLLFMSEPEERDKNNQGLYFLPNFRQLIYAGYAGPRSAVREAQKYNNLAHPICENLRNGNWLIDFLDSRLPQCSVTNYLRQIHQNLKNIPRYLIPAYFCRLVNLVYDNCLSIVSGSTLFKQELQLASYQFLANLPSSKGMSAGLPHFTTGWSRCWGRDTFIAFKGIYLLNNLIKEAKECILLFASTLRHGLIPNLLDSCNSPRYNCRDACWWFIKSIKDYCSYVKSYDILKEEIQMIFLDDDIDKHYQMKYKGITIKKSLAEIVQTIFQSHATGIQFREWKAGSQIDQQMQSEGFNISLRLDEETGFIVGGNWLNCLTWMDKMGSAEVNRGIPATSRDGAPIELTALLKVCLDFVIHAQNYPYDGVICANNKKLLFKEWSHFIAINFEKYYWVPKLHDTNYQEYVIVEKHVRHRQIYKDIVKSSKPRNEYQLRCNASVAIGLAPELFSKEKAKLHLAAVEAYLIKPNSLGLKTLDPAASEYLHYYDNADQSKIFNVSNGFSYHNGPEWVWVYGYFIKALINVHGKEHIQQQLFYSYLCNHKINLHHNEWYSLPEMTNGDGEYNIYSCRAQAWSIASLLEAISDYEQL